MPAARTPHFDSVYTQRAADLASKWVMSAGFVRHHAKEGRISGSRKFGSEWRFTADATFAPAAPSTTDYAVALKKMKARRATRERRATSAA